MTWPGGCHFGRWRRRYQRLSTSVAAPPITAVAAAAAPVARNDLDDMAGSCPAPAGPTRGRGSSRYIWRGGFNLSTQHRVVRVGRTVVGRAPPRVFASRGVCGVGG